MLVKTAMHIIVSKYSIDRDYQNILLIEIITKWVIIINS